MKYTIAITRLFVICIILYNYINDLFQYFGNDSFSLDLPGVLIYSFFIFIFILYSSVQARKEFAGAPPINAIFLRIYAMLYELYNIIANIFIGWYGINSNTIDLSIIDLVMALLIITFYSILLYADIKISRNSKSNNYRMF